MKIIKLLNVLFSIILFLKEWNLGENQLQKNKKRLPYLMAVWIFFVLPIIFPLSNIFSEISGNTGFQLSLLFILIFSIYHWWLLIFISRFAKRHIIYFLLLLPIIVALVWNLRVWNSPTYYGAMDGFAGLATMVEQMMIIFIFPTFLFALRMTEITPKLKGILLTLIILISGFLGIQKSIGKEGYLSDGTGSVFVFLILLLTTIAFYLIFKTGKTKQL